MVPVTLERVSEMQDTPTCYGLIIYNRAYHASIIAFPAHHDKPPVKQFNAGTQM